jgi:hypothetical protein
MPNKNVQVTGEDFRAVIAALEENTLHGQIGYITAPSRGLANAQIWEKERERMLPVLNVGTNTISTELKRVTILQEMVRAFSLQVMPLSLLSTVFKDVPLEGTDKIEVPYLPIRTDASTDFVAANGYQFSGTTEMAVREIPVDKRKYQPMDFDSATFRRQPYFKALELGLRNVERLGYDVIQDVLSIVTAANYGAAIKTEPAASLDADDIIDIGGAVGAADVNWPETGRGLIVNNDVNTALMKDPAYKLALNFGGTEILRQGKMPDIGGFRYAKLASLPANAENLIAMAIYASAILVAMCPVAPAPGVRSQLLAYDVVTDPLTGIAFNFRYYGDAQMDKDYQVVEVAYGYAKGEAAACKRICSQ